MGFVARILHNQDDSNKRHKVAAQYFPTHHVGPTSNVCERLFSRAKLVMGPHRRLMDPSTLEAFSILRMNKEHWNIINKTASERKKAIAEALARQAQGEESNDEDV